MKKIILLSLLAAIFFSQCTPKVTDAIVEEVKKETTFRSGPPAPGPAPKIQLGTYDSFTAPNGLQVIVVENHKIPRVSFQLFIDKPAFMEDDIAGYSQMAGQLIKTGTSSKSKVEIDEAIDFMGANLSSSSSGMYGSSLRKHTDNLLSIMSDVLLNPSFPEKQFDRIKKQTISGLASDKEDPSAISSKVASALRYGKDHPYGEMMTEETVNNITLQQCKDYYKKYFQPNMSYLVVVGDITPAEAKPMIDKYFGAWKKGTAVSAKKFAKPTPPSNTQVDFVNKTGAVQSVLSVTYPVDIKPGSADAIPASVMNTMLGGFFRSKLNNNLREDKAYTYGSRSSLRPDKEIGSFSAGASVRNEVTDSALIEIIKEFNDIRNMRISKEDLTLVKNVMAGNFARSLERPETVARFALNTARHKLPADYYETYLEKLSAVTAADVQTMAKKYILPENAHIVVVGNKDEVAEKLSFLDADGKINHYDIYANEIVMDDNPLPDGLSGKNIIEDYLNALGGKDKLLAIKDLKTVMTTEMQGMALTSTVLQQAPNLFSNEMSVAGMGVIQNQTFDGVKGMMSGMGQETPMEGEQLESMKAMKYIFNELIYLEEGYTLDLKGTEAVDGVKAYKLIITTPAGKTKTEFYDASTSLKIREVQVSEMQGQKMTQTTDYSDYKEVDGIQYPHLLTISGSTPTPLKMKVVEVKMNGGIDAAKFKIK